MENNQNREVILRVKHLKQFFKMKGAKLKAVNDVSFDVYKGEVFGIVGESGCGKTTTGRSIIKLYNITSGDIIFKGQRVSAGTRWNRKEIKYKRIKTAAAIEKLEKMCQEEIANAPESEHEAIKNKYALQIKALETERDRVVEEQRAIIRQANYDQKYGPKLYAQKRVKEVNQYYDELINNVYSNSSKFSEEQAKQLTAEIEDLRNQVNALKVKCEEEIKHCTLASKKRTYVNPNTNAVIKLDGNKDSSDSATAKALKMFYQREIDNLEKQIKVLENRLKSLGDPYSQENAKYVASLKRKKADQIRFAKHDNVMTKMQMIFQDPIASLDPRMTVREIIAEGLRIRGIRDKEYINEKVYEVLELVGLVREHANRYPHEFSGGQRQRIGIARAIIMEPELIIADEPVSALDVSVQAQVINLLNELREKMGLTIIFIAHNLSVVKYFSDRIAVMYFGKIVELATSHELFEHPLHPYTKSLLSAIPQPDPEYEKQRKRITYNPLAEHDYSKDKPTLKEVEPGHFVYCDDAEYEKYLKELNNGTE